MDLIKKSQLLEKEAQEVLKNLKLVKILEQVGEVEIIGSLELGLMVWRDIDFEVVVDQVDRNEIAKIVDSLAILSSRRIDFSLVDNADWAKEKFPKGFYLGIKYNLEKKWVSSFSKNESTWKIDIWFLTSEDARSAKEMEKIKRQLTEEKKEIILEIKEAYYRKPEYKKSVTALDIYKAVLDSGVKSVEEFQKYLLKS